MSDKTPVVVTNVPQPVGPYSTAIQCENLLFISGQLPVDPQTGRLSGEDAASQTRQILENIRAILDAVEMGLHRVTKTTLFLTDLEQFDAVNEVYAEYFKFEPPARSCVQVAALPKNARVMIEAIAVGPRREANAKSKGFI